MAQFSNLTSDLTELILSLLPIPSLLRSSAVCKLWHSIVRSPSFLSPHRPRPPWFFLYGLHNTNSNDNQSFAFDPLSDFWFRLPPFPLPPPASASDGFFFATTPHFSFSPIFNPSWTTTSPLRFSRINPLLGLNRHFIVVGGVRLNDGLFDIEDRLSVEIYNPDADFWELCSPLPPDIRSGNSSHSLSSALFEGKFYVLGIYSFFVSCFDLHHYVWSEVQTLRPPGIVFSFLISCSNRLVLAGICYSPSGTSFVVWKIEVETIEFSEISIMPSDLLHSLVEGDEEDGFGNEENQRKYPVCVCEINGENGKCRWKRVPPLPFRLNKFHNIITFASTVSLNNILGQEDEEDEHYSSLSHLELIS
ncbi:unnamed protein product [Citrullus colocynthis]|uniref:F-box domain-containing protein n=1 Tax=Citrullus colocynthis TaxID=252529 RepID=A0ABP0XNP0_9ROSI